MRQGIPEDLFKRNEEALHDRESRIHVLGNEVVWLHVAEFPMQEVTAGRATLLPTPVSLGFGHEAKVPATGPGTTPTVIVTASWRRLPSASEQEHLHRFLLHRLDVDTLRLVNVASRQATLRHAAFAVSTHTLLRPDSLAA